LEPTARGDPKTWLPIQLWNADELREMIPQMINKIFDGEVPKKKAKKLSRVLDEFLQFEIPEEWPERTKQLPAELTSSP